MSKDDARTALILLFQAGAALAFCLLIGYFAANQNEIGLGFTIAIPLVLALCYLTHYAIWGD